MDLKSKLKVATLMIMAVGVLELGIVIGLSLPSMMFVRREVKGAQPEAVLAAEGALNNYTAVLGITENYYNEHQYYIDVYDCDQMSSDLWDQFMARGINSKLVAGDVEKDITAPEDINHVWVIAEIVPGQWIAADPTEGGVHLNKISPRYYKGYVFDDPTQMMNFLYRYVPGGIPDLTSVTPLPDYPERIVR